MRPYVPFNNQTIYINADGSIDPSGAPILRNGDLYVLTGNITSSSDGIVIERDHIVLNGAGYTIQGTGVQNGIYLYGVNNVAVKNITIEAFESGIWLRYASNICISGNMISENNWTGIFLYAFLNTSISGNNIVNDLEGISLESSPSNYISGNKITENVYGAIVSDSSNNAISENTITTNYRGILFAHSSNNSITTNNIKSNNEGFNLESS